MNKKKGKRTLFLLSPNLPQSKVTSVFLGGKYCDLFNKPLQEIEVRTLPVPPCETLSGEEQSHADMLLHHLGESRVVAYKNLCCKDKSLYAELGVEICESETPLQIGYPQNIALNGLRIGNLFFHLLRYTDGTLKSLLTEKNCKLISVKQGYSKCAVAVVDEHSAITSDSGMANAMRDAGIDVLLIRPGFIRLGDENSGFIGGCCGKLSKDCLAFTGNLNEHPDKDQILNFLEHKKVYPYFLRQDLLIDVGSILPLTEEDPADSK